MIPEENLVKGDKGTIVMVYPKISDTQDYEIEFCDSNGYTLALLTLPEDILEQISFE